MEAPPATGRPVYAGFLKRFLAFSIDILLILLFLYLASGVTDLLYGRFYGSAPGDGMEFLVFTALFQVFFTFFYFVYFIANGGQTPGKTALGIKVTDLGGKEPGYARSLFRAIGYYISSSFLMIGFLWMLVDKKHQAWHDKLAGTVVVEI